MKNGQSNGWDFEKGILSLCTLCFAYKNTERTGQSLLTYMADTKVENATTDLLREIQDMVDIVKGDAEVSKKAMRIDEKIRDAREEGREEIRALLGAKTEEAEKRADEEKSRADEAESRANESKARAEQAEAELERLKQELARLKK